MKIPAVRLSLAVLVLSLYPFESTAGSHGDSEGAKDATTAEETPARESEGPGPVYRPPESLGVPFGRTGGGVRSAKPTYVPPPDVGAPGGRTPGGTRGESPPIVCPLPKLQVLYIVEILVDHH